MRPNLFFLTCLVIFSIGTSYSSNIEYYYGGGEKREIIYDSGLILVKYEDNVKENDKSSIEKDFSLELFEKVSENKIIYGTNGYESKALAHDLSKLEYIDFVTPVYRCKITNDLILIEDTFGVWLIDSTGEEALRALNYKYDVEILDVGPFNFYHLRLINHEELNVLDLSRIYYWGA